MLKFQDPFENEIRRKNNHEIFKQKFEHSFQNILVSNYDFKGASEETTKNLDNLEIRIMWETSKPFLLFHFFEGNTEKISSDFSYESTVVFSHFTLIVRQSFS